MKKLLKQFSSDERVFNIEKGIETLQTEIKNNENKTNNFFIYNLNPLIILNLFDLFQ